MNPEKNHWTVLARIPDMNSQAEDCLASDESGWLPTSAGRLIQQAMSFKLLVGTALFLLVAAIVPLFTSRTPPTTTDPAAIADQSPTWHSEPTSATAEALPAQDTATPPTVAAKPATVIPATAEPTRPPAVVSSEPKTKAPPEPTRVAERPLMSTWPKPSTK